MARTIRPGRAAAGLGLALALLGGAAATGAAQDAVVAPDRRVEVPVDRPWHTCPAKGKDRSLRYYPARALREEVEGSATIQCRFTAEGASTACVWLTEPRPDMGFGESAEKLGCLFKMKASPTGEPFVAQIPIEFKLPR